MNVLVLHAKKLNIHMLAISVALVFAVFSFAPNLSAQTEQLSITDVSVTETDSVSKTATIVWKTNLLSQSIVVCGNETQAPFEFDVTADNFGYTWSTIILGGVTLDHRMPLAQLSEETHYCRAASRINENSPWVVSEEIIFNTNEETATVTGAEASNEWDNDINQGVEGDTKEEKETAPIGIFNQDVCSDNWTVWALVLIALLIATLWSRELVEKLMPSESSRRLYVLGGAGLIVFLIALINGAGNWVVPVGIGTMAIIAATIVDVVRSEDAQAKDRLRKIITTLLVSVLVAFILAIILGWTCAVTPIAVIAIALAIRHYMFNKEEEATEEIVEEKRIMKREEKEEDED